MTHDITSRPARGLVYVRPVETAESIPGGRIILTEATRQNMTSCQAEVVSVGAPAYCSDVDCERPHGWLSYDITSRWHATVVQRGDWVIVMHRSLTETHLDGLFCCNQDEVLAILKQ